MADAPGIRNALASVKSDIQRLNDVIDGLQKQVAEVKAEKAVLVSIRDDYQAYIDFKATQP